MVIAVCTKMMLELHQDVTQVNSKADVVMLSSWVIDCHFLGLPNS
jgi:hypothetical protein